MIHNSQSYELVHKLRIRGTEYAIFFHAKSRRKSFWVFRNAGWQRVADVYNVPEFLKYTQRLKAHSVVFAWAWASAGLIVGLLMSALIIEAF